MSHDERLIEMVADELWVVRPGPKPGVPGTVAVFDGTFEEYTNIVSLNESIFVKLCAQS